MLTPFTLIDATTDGQHITVPAASALARPFSLAQGTRIAISVIHLEGGQDYALKCWITIDAGEGPVILIPPGLSYFHPDRLGLDVVIAYDKSTVLPIDNMGLAMPLNSGDYVLMIENRTNSDNAVAIRLNVF